MWLEGCAWHPAAEERLTVSADKTLSWSYTEDFTAEDEATAQARIRGLELGITPVSSGTGAALRMLAASVGAKSVAEVGTGTGVSGLWLLSGMGTDGVLTTIDVEPELQREARRAFDGAAGVSGLWLLGGMGTDGVLTTIDVEPELQREARRAFDGAGYPSSRTRIIQGRASDVMPRMAARSYDMVVLDVAPEEAILLASNALRMLRPGGVLAVTRALWNDHVADPARRDVTTVAAGLPRAADHAAARRRRPARLRAPDLTVHRPTGRNDEEGRTRIGSGPLSRGWMTRPPAPRRRGPSGTRLPPGARIGQILALARASPSALTSSAVISRTSRPPPSSGTRMMMARPSLTTSRGPSPVRGFMAAMCSPFVSAARAHRRATCHILRHSRCNVRGRARHDAIHAPARPSRSLRAALTT